MHVWGELHFYNFLKFLSGAPKVKNAKYKFLFWSVHKFVRVETKEPVFGSRTEKLPTSIVFFQQKEQ